MNTTYLVGGAGAVAILAAGFSLLIPPQNAALSDKQDALATVQASNERAELQIPKLKSQLKDIAPKVDQLRALAAQVPPDIDQATLFNELSAAAAQAGLSGLSNESISLPTLVKNAQSSASASTDSTDATTADATVDSTPAPTPAATADAATSSGAGDASAAASADAASVIASYDVSMSATGTTDQVVAFLRALGSTKRLNVPSSCTLQVGADGTATLTLTTRFYLQKVDVDGLASQIETLNKSMTSEQQSGHVADVPSAEASPVATGAAGIPTPQPSGN